VEAVRERFGEQMLLQVDANAAYTLADARVLRRLDAFDLLLIEQPLPEDDLRQHAELARLIRTPICLDESVVSVRSAADAIALRAAQVINIKAGRVGGYLNARRIHDLCQANGIPVWCGGMVETGLGRAANAALAALPGFTLPGDISASDRFYELDITPPFVLDDGRIEVPTGPGLGWSPSRVCSSSSPSRRNGSRSNCSVQQGVEQQRAVEPHRGEVAADLPADQAVQLRPDQHRTFGGGCVCVVDTAFDQPSFELVRQCAVESPGSGKAGFELPDNCDQRIHRTL
jgi:hypothetical protein